MAFPGLSEGILHHAVSLHAMHGNCPLHLACEMELSEEDFALVLHTHSIRAQSPAFPPARRKSRVPLVQVLWQPVFRDAKRFVQTDFADERERESLQVAPHLRDEFAERSRVW
jgi:hypothetical protein